MKNCFLLLFLLISQAMAVAQAVSNRVYKSKIGTLTYSYLHAEKPCKGIIIGLHDDDPVKWKPETWCQQLSSLALPLGWSVLVPHANLSQPKEMTLLQNVLEQYSDSIQEGSMVVMSLGTGVQSAAALCSQDLPGLIISPRWQSFPIFPQAESPIAVVGNNQTFKARILADTLGKKGYWVLLDSLASDDPYFSPNHHLRYVDAIQWADSLYSALSTPEKKDKLERQAGVKSTVPEVVRQGQSITLQLFISRHGSYVIEVQELSGKVLQSQKLFYPKGHHEVNVETSGLEWGVFNLAVSGMNINQRYKFIVRG